MDAWTDLDLIPEFVKESNKLAHIYDIGSEQSGHYNAMLEAYEMGKAHQPLTFKELDRWHQWIHQRPENDKLAVTPSFFTQLASHLQALGPVVNEIALVELIAKTTFEFIMQDTNGKARGRVARLLANYIAAWCHHPLLVFYEREREDLKKSQKSLNLLKLFVAKKIRESIFNSQGELMQYQKGNLLNGHYIAKSGEERIIQWNALSEEELKWLHDTK